LNCTYFLFNFGCYSYSCISVTSSHEDSNSLFDLWDIKQIDFSTAVKHKIKLAIKWRRGDAVAIPPLWPAGVQRRCIQVHRRFATQESGLDSVVYRLLRRPVSSMHVWNNGHRPPGDSERKETSRNGDDDLEGDVISRLVCRTSKLRRLLMQWAFSRLVRTRSLIAVRRSSNPCASRPLTCILI